MLTYFASMHFRNRMGLFAGALFFAVAGVSAVSAQEPVKLGAVIAQSGTAALIGRLELEGTRLAVQKINERGGIKGRPIQLLIEDNETSAPQSIRKFRQVVEQGAVAVIGPELGQTCYGVEPVSRELKVPTYCLSGVPLPAKSDYFFMPWPNPQVYAALHLPYFAKQGKKRMGVISTTDPTGQALSKLSIAAAPNNGVEVVAHETFNSEDVDVKAQLAKILVGKPDFIWVAATGQPAITVFSNLKDLGVDLPVAMSWGNTNVNFLTSAKGVLPKQVVAGGMKITVFKDLVKSDPQTAPIQAFVQDYQKAYGRDPELYAGLAWDAVHIFAKALAAVPNPKDGTAVRDWLEKNIKNYIGVTGIYTLGPDQHRGVDAGEAVLVGVRDGRFFRAQ